MTYIVHMDLRKLRYFVAAAEEENFRRAAERLHVSQPTLSQHIQELESELGVRLFERLPRGVRLSEAGALILDEVRRSMARLDDAVQQARRAEQGQPERLRIAFSEVAVRQAIVAEALHRFRGAQPDVALELVLMNSAEQRQALLEDAIDAGFHHTPAPERGIESVVLGADRYVMAIARHDPLAAEKRITVEHLPGRTYLWAYRRSTVQTAREATLEYFTALGIAPSRIIHTGSDIAAINLAAVGMGVGLVLSSQRPGAPKSVVYRELPGPSRILQAVLGWRRGNASRPLRQFVDIVARLAP